MNETRFRDLERLYERAGKPRWPWWWYGVGIVLCVLALILVLCSGPGKARAEDAAPAPAAASAEVCAAIETHLQAIVTLSVLGAFARVTVGLQLVGIDPADPNILAAINSDGAKAAGQQFALAKVKRNAQAILLAFGCATD